MSPQRVQNLQRSLVKWYASAARPLPWRATDNAYRILISEVMLQQTQVSRVLQKYPPFLRRFSSFRSLASSTPASVLRAWKGMGYNNRAIRLREVAQVVMSRWNGRLPSDPNILQDLPGIGRYTANAVACFAFGRQVPVVDTNIHRVFSRLFPRIKDHWKLAETLLPRRLAYEWNQGLMELGATICSPAHPSCSACPVRSLCPSAYRTPARSRNAAKSEPARGGIPNRIFRGRIIEELRNLRVRKSIGLVELGQRIKARFSHRDERWLAMLARSLERDGLVRFESRRKRVSFAK